MNNTNELFSELKNNLMEAAFLATNADYLKATHTKILECLMIISNLEKHRMGEENLQASFGQNSKRINLKNASIEVQEIKKVEKRLKKWQNSPEQNNSMILMAFIVLRKNALIPITVNMLKKEFFRILQGKIPSISHSRMESVFANNFPQMKNMASSNHGKVFEQHGNVISIWEPVLLFVNEFESKIYNC